MATVNVRRFVTRVEVVRETLANEHFKPVRKGAKLTTPKRVRELFDFLETRPTEEFHAALVNVKHALETTVHISTGTLTASLVHPREVFRPALTYPGVAALICVHNHPSGDSKPSMEDLELTRRLIEAGRLLGVPLLDHVIVGAGGMFTSLRDTMPEFKA